MKPALLSLALVLTALPARPDDRAPSVVWGGELDAGRRYVWLGQPFSHGAVVQPSLWATRGAFTANAWGSFNLDPLAGSERHLAELDLIVSWAGKLGPVATTVTSDSYFWNTPTTRFVNTEVFLRTAVTTSGVELFAVQLLDLRRYRGAYHVAAGAALSRTCGQGWSWSAQGSLGWSSARFNRFYLGVARSGLLEAALDLSLRRDLGRHVYLRAHLGVSTLVDHHLRAAQAEPTQVTPGFAIGFQ